MRCHRGGGSWARKLPSRSTSVSVLNAHRERGRNINAAAVVFALAQYPAYGTAVVAGTKNSKAAWLTLVCLHLAGAVVSLIAVQRSEVFG